MTEKVIQIEHLSYDYPDGSPALQEIDLEVYRHESIAILGPNGAGKSTLLYHLNGTLTGRGKVTVLGLPVEKKNLQEIRRRVGVVFQSPDDQLFCPTVYDDVAFGPLNMGLGEEEVRSRVERALDMVGLNGFEERSAHHLSEGEKKRVALATVLSMDSEILAMDEDAKVIVITAIDQREALMEAIRVGAADYIIKPFETDRVLSAIRKVFGEG